MTIAVSLKVHDGLVLAADSASTLIGNTPDGKSVVQNVYNNANKVFNLCKGIPIGAITWGAGSIGHASIYTLAKDLRKRFTGAASNHADWKLSPSNYSMQAIAEQTRAFLYEENYLPFFNKTKVKPSLGFIVAGYSSGEDQSEVWQIAINNGDCPAPELLRSKDDPGVNWNGEPEAIARILLGYGSGLANALKDLGVPDDQIAPAVEQIGKRLAIPVVHAPMPIQDAIDLAAFLVDTTIKFSRFTIGAPTVGGPIEVAAITRHEGFKWIQRKYYYDVQYNPEIEGVKEKYEEATIQRAKVK